MRSIGGPRSKIEQPKNCYCFTCDRFFNALGIARHRAMHRDRRENCRIGYTDGRTVEHKFSEMKK